MNIRISPAATNIARVTNDIEQAAGGAFTPKQLVAYKQFNIRALKALIADRVNSPHEINNKDAILNAVRLALHTVQSGLNRASLCAGAIAHAVQYDEILYRELTLGTARKMLDVICLHPNEASLMFRCTKAVKSFWRATHYAASAEHIRDFIDDVAYSFHPELRQDYLNIFFAIPLHWDIGFGTRVRFKHDALRSLGDESGYPMTAQEAHANYRKFCFYVSARDFRRRLPKQQRLVLADIDRIARQHPGVKNFIARGIRLADDFWHASRANSRRYEQAALFTVAQLSDAVEFSSAQWAGVASLKMRVVISDQSM